MPSRRITFPAVAALAIASVILGVLAALASGRDTKPAPPAVRVLRSASPVALARRARTPVPSIVYAAPCAPSTAEKAPTVEPVPQNVLDAFGVLRRDRTAEDALPDAALDALRDRGLEPFDPAAARLLRTDPSGGRAWVVPVRDVADPAIIGLRCVLRQARPPAVRKLPRPTRPVPATPTTPRAEAPPAVSVPTPATPATPVPAPRPTLARSAPHPGLAVVALDGAPAGAGGRLEDLVRGREAVAIDACGGPNRNMLSVSGIVPDGVGAAFLTSPDGTAVRADVKDNAYAFVVPRTRRAEARYVVWTGGDGTPHVQPLGSPAFLGRARCATSTTRQPPVVSPDGSGLCGHFFRTPVITMATTPDHAPSVLYQAPCAIAPATALPIPARPLPAPKRRK